MRVSEKTIELNFCAQVSGTYPGRLLWFGLTQRQEAHAGFDACTRLGGWLALFQFKASSHDVPSPAGTARRFHAPHDQLQRLQERVRPNRRIFYVFPLIGRTDELAKNSWAFLPTTWLLDVGMLPHPFAPPTTAGGSKRKNGIHYVDVVPGHAIIHSEPVPARLIRAVALGDLLQTEPVADVTRGGEETTTFDDFWRRRERLFRRAAVGAIVLPP